MESGRVAPGHMRFRLSVGLKRPEVDGSTPSLTTSDLAAFSPETPCASWVSGCLLNSPHFATFRDISRPFTSFCGLSADFLTDSSPDARSDRVF